MGKASDPCGIAVLIGIIGSLSLSNNIDANHLLRKESTNLIILGCSFILHIVCRSLDL
jgi:hypothetical protein